MSEYFHFWVFAIFSAALTLAPIAASADTSRGQFVVSVTVIRECRIAVQNLTIDTATASQRTVVARGAVALSCSRNTAYVVSLGSGVNTAGAADPVSVAGMGNGANQIIPVYNRMLIDYSNANGVQAEPLVMTIFY